MFGWFKSKSDLQARIAELEEENRVLSGYNREWKDIAIGRGLKIRDLATRITDLEHGIALAVPQLDAHIVDQRAMRRGAGPIEAVVGTLKERLDRSVAHPLPIVNLDEVA